MNKLIFIFFTILSISISFAQTTADFENIIIDPDLYLNGSDGEGGFESGNILLPNFYNANYNSWSGWAISKDSDTITPGFYNQYSSVTGSGFDDSENYAVTYIFDRSRIILKEQALGNVVNGFYATNSTYAYLSMLNGDGYAKIFGGLTGDDPDYFLVKIKKYKDGVLSSDEVDFYLADYRLSDNDQDYIIDEWTWVDLTSLGEVDSLELSFESSDNGQFGINTPTYFCMDNLITSDGITSVNDIYASSMKLFSNPAVNNIHFENSFGNGVLSVYNEMGKLMLQRYINIGPVDLNVTNFDKGLYLLKLQYENKILSEKFIKI